MLAYNQLNYSRGSKDNGTEKIAVIVGSLRKESFNRKMAKALMKVSPDSLNLEIIEIGGLPLYNQDLDDNPPAAWSEFRERLKKFDGVLFVTPEYNRSVPGVLKNAIDVGSRPMGKTRGLENQCGCERFARCYRRLCANHHLRQSLVFLNVPAMPQPEAYIGKAGISSMSEATCPMSQPENSQ